MNGELSADKISYFVKDKKTGRKHQLLQPTSLFFKAGSFTSIIGASGAGKSTLLRLLSGRQDSTAGVIRASGFDLAGQFSLIKKEIAFVPQHVELHQRLTIEQELGFSAELKSDVSESCEPFEMVEKTLQIVDLKDRQRQVISSLSGGQKKRLSLANEIICDPQFIFLDEVTSGLDEKGDQEIMELCSRLAKKNKTVIQVTHNVSNITEFSDRLIVLAEGGWLAYSGPPNDALGYFGVNKLSEIYEVLQSKPAPIWTELFLKANPVEKTGKISPQSVPQVTSDAQRESAEIEQVKEQFHTFRDQAKVLVNRYVVTKLADQKELLGLCTQCLLISVLLVMVFGDFYGDKSRLLDAQSMSFLLALSAFWFGCNSSIKELVKERSITLREASAGLNILSYLSSKVVVLCAFSFLQVSVLLVLVRLFCNFPGSFVGQVLILSVSSFCGVGIGLLSSTLANSEETATSILPCLLIPQVILAGVIVKLKGAGLLLATTFVSTFWSYSGFVHTLPEKYENLQEDKWSGTGSFLVLLFAFGFLLAATFASLLVRNSKKQQLQADIKGWQKTGSTILRSRYPGVLARVKTWLGLYDVVNEKEQEYSSLPTPSKVEPVNDKPNPDSVVPPPLSKPRTKTQKPVGK